MTLCCRICGSKVIEHKSNPEIKWKNLSKKQTFSCVVGSIHSLHVTIFLVRWWGEKRKNILYP